MPKIKRFRLTESTKFKPVGRPRPLAERLLEHFAEYHRRYPRHKTAVDEINKQLLDNTYAKSMAIMNAGDSDGTPNGDRARNLNMALIHRGLRNNAEPDNSISRFDSRVADDAKGKRAVVSDFVKARKQGQAVGKPTALNKHLNQRTQDINNNSNPLAAGRTLPNGRDNLDYTARTAIKDDRKGAVKIDPNNPRKVTGFNDPQNIIPNVKSGYLHTLRGRVS